MNKKNIVGISVLIIIIIVFISSVKPFFSSAYSISIANRTNKTVENLELRYKVGKSIQTIPQIEPKKFWKGKIDTNEIQGENAVILTYIDNKGNPYEEYVIGYLEKGYSGQVSMAINKIDDNGKLEIEIK